MVEFFILSGRTQFREYLIDNSSNFLLAGEEVIDYVKKIVKFYYNLITIAI